MLSLISFDLFEQRLYAVQHLIEGKCQLVYLVSSPLDGNAFFKRAARYLLSRSRDGFNPGDSPPGHEPTDAGSQQNQDSHRGDENFPESFEKTRIAFHRQTHLQDDAGTERGIENPHLLRAARNIDLLKHRIMVRETAL